MDGYILLASESTGLHLCDGTEESSFGLRPRCDDSCVWEWESASSLRNAATGGVVTVEPIGALPGPIQAAAIDAAFGPGASLLVPQKYRLVSDAHRLAGLGDQLLFSAREAPTRLPSEPVKAHRHAAWRNIS